MGDLQFLPLGEVEKQSASSPVLHRPTAHREEPVLPQSVSAETYAAADRGVVVEMPPCPDCASSMGR